jgi:S1-C subfamily serine protease
MEVIMKRMSYVNYILAVVLSFGCLGTAFGEADDKKITIVYDDDRSDEKAWLGVQIKELTKKLRQELDTKARYGIVIDEVVDNSPADEAGLEPGDVIVKLDNRNLRKVKDLTGNLAKKAPEDEILLEIMRGREREKITVILGSRSDRNDWIGALPNIHFRGFVHGTYLGVEVQEMNEDLAQYFDVTEDDGVLVTSVDEDGPAMEAGLKAGDVLVTMDGEEITDSESISDILEEFEVDSEIEIEYIRKGRKENVAVILEEKPFSLKSFTIPKAEAAPSPPDFDTRSSERYRSRTGEWRNEYQRDSKKHAQEMEELKKELDEIKDEMKRLKENFKK